MTSLLIIRSAIREDIPLVMQFLKWKAEFDGCPERLIATPEALDKYLFGSDALGGVYLAEHNGNVIGFATYFSTFSSFLGRPGIWLDDLYVLEAERGRGAGTALLRQLAKTAQERGCGRLEWIVSATNSPAIAFYERIGAQVREHTRLCRVDTAAIEKLANITS